METEESGIDSNCDGICLNKFMSLIAAPIPILQWSLNH